MGLNDRSIGYVLAESIDASSPVPAATEATRAGKSGRFAVEIQATGGDAYIGNETVSSGDGLLIKEGTSRVFPVNRIDAIYVVSSGAVTIADYYEG